MKLVLIPPGEFIMGSPKEVIEEELKTPGIEGWYKDRLPGEGPQHRVRITKPFYFGLYVVTQEEYQRVMGINPSEFSATGKSRDKVAGQETKQFPVEQVSWDDAVEFCRKLSEMPQERAARANVSSAIGGAVGVCVPRGEHGPVQFQFGPQRDSQGVRGAGAVRLRVVQRQFRRDAAQGGTEASVRVGIV